MGCILGANRFEAALKDSEKKERGVDIGCDGYRWISPPWWIFWIPASCWGSWHGIQGIQGIDQNVPKQIIEWWVFASGVGCGHDGDDLQQEWDHLWAGRTLFSKPHICKVRKCWNHKDQEEHLCFFLTAGIGNEWIVGTMWSWKLIKEDFCWFKTYNLGNIICSDGFAENLLHLAFAFKFSLTSNRHFVVHRAGREWCTTCSRIPWESEEMNGYLPEVKPKKTTALLRMLSFPACGIWSLKSITFF